MISANGRGFLTNQYGVQNSTVIGVNSTQLGSPGKTNPGIAVDLRNSSILTWLETQEMKVLNTAVDILPQNIDEELKVFSGAGDKIPLGSCEC